MRSLLIAVFNLSVVVVVLGVHQPDINRLVPVLKASKTEFHEPDTSINNDYAHHSSRFLQREPSLPMPLLLDRSKTTSALEKTYQPREDPRLFYQSHAYLKRKTDQENINSEVAAVYPGREVVRAYERPKPRVRVARERLDRLVTPFSQGIPTQLCVRCPQDKALIAKPGSSRVYLENPRLKSCTGHLAPRNIRFIQMYGPRFGSLIGEGAHMLVGKIVQGNQVMQHCKMQVNVVTQGCHTPPHLVSSCEGRQCVLSCRDSKLELLGSNKLACGSDMKWEGDLPVCRARTWCEPLPPPDRGRISCQGAAVDRGLAEGTRCRTRCQRGWRSSRAVAVCRRGLWTQELQCRPLRKP